MRRIVNFGPQHPSVHGALRIVLELEGEMIIRAEPHIGFLHRGIEKILESKTYLQCISYFDCLDYTSAMNQEHAFVLAIEKLLDIVVPARGKCIRVLFCEIGRLLNHSFVIATMIFDIGMLSPFLWLLAQREILVSFYEQVSGSRIQPVYFRPGGVYSDLPENLLQDIEKFCNSFLECLKDIEDVLNENPIFKQRCVGIGSITSEEAENYGLSGPILRACGLPRDLRKDEPYDDYDLYEFNIPITKNGDAYDRYLIRMAEMKESVEIIRQCISRMPSGNFSTNNFEFCDFKKTNSLKTKKDEESRLKFVSSIDARINQFIEIHDLTIPSGEIYQAIEAPKGEFGVFIVADGSAKPYRCKIRAPGFAALQAFDHLARNHLLSDIPTILSSLDIVLGEIDR